MMPDKEDVIISSTLCLIGTVGVACSMIYGLATVTFFIPIVCIIVSVGIITLGASIERWGLWDKTIMTEKQEKNHFAINFSMEFSISRKMMIILASIFAIYTIVYFWPYIKGVIGA